MAESPHYKELLQLLNEFELEYLIVGGSAVMKYSEPRSTKDLDVWGHNSRQNSLRKVEALNKFGAPVSSAFDSAGVEFRSVHPVRENPAIGPLSRRR